VARALSSSAAGTRISLLSIEPWPPPRPPEAHGGEQIGDDHGSEGGGARTSIEVSRVAAFSDIIPASKTWQDTMTSLNNNERTRRARTHYVREMKAALRVGQSTEERSARRKTLSDEWEQWFSDTVSANNTVDASDCLPLAFAKLEMNVNDSINLAISTLKRSLRRALDEQ
jgi:hypothetical protein